MRLLDLPGNTVSLELAPAEIASVLRSLSRMGGRQHRCATIDVVEIAGTRLIVMADWDEPCLISVDAAGSEILRELATDPSRAEVA